jgi:ABC-type antimicrobial peptide transport system permease subunit
MGFSKANNIQTKFDTNTMYLLSIDPVRDGYSPEKAQALFEKLPERLRSIGSVRSVALASEPPFSIATAGVQLSSASLPGASHVLKSVVKHTVGAGYFTALGEPMLAGRQFAERDRETASPLPVVLDESAARGLFGDGSALGQRVTEDKRSYEIVGVVRDLKSGIPDETGRSGSVYLPLTRSDFASPPAGGITIMVRSDAGVDALGAIRREIASIDPNLAVFDVRTLAEYLDLCRSYMRLALDTYSGIGVFGLVLAAIGLAGVTAYAVARRRKEIGIRIALGARRGQVLRLVLREGAALVTVGTALGFLGAMAMVKVLSALTSIFVDSFQVSTDDPRLIIGAPLLLAALAMVACYIPARRSARIDPLKALREEG